MYKTKIKFIPLLLTFLSLCCMPLDATSNVNLSSLISDECRGVDPGKGRILLCETYCKVLKCDELPENPIGILGKLRAKACDSTFQKWSKVAPGEVLPCLVQPAIALSKEVVGLSEEGTLNAGADVRYKFTITNEGDTPLENIELSDPTLTSDALNTCSLDLSGFVLDVGGTFECTSDAGWITATLGVNVENTATVSAESTTGLQVVSPVASAAYIVVGNQEDIVFAFYDKDSDGKYTEGTDDLYVKVTDTNGNHEIDAGDSIHVLLLPIGVDTNSLSPNFGAPIFPAAFAEQSFIVSSVNNLSSGTSFDVLLDLEGVDFQIRIRQTTSEIIDIGNSILANRRVSSGPGDQIALVIPVSDWAGIAEQDPLGGFFSRDFDS